MYGAILGDMIGAPFEYDRGNKSKKFPLFSEESQFTDDSVMTIAVCDALLSWDGNNESALKYALVQSMQRWGQKYPDEGYGVRFSGWLRSANPKPYGSYGNGSAMRVSSVGWLYDSLEKTRDVARITASVTHDHPEGIKGAESTAAAIFLARNGSSKDEIRKYITDEFGYDLSRTCDEIRPGYHHVESCQETVPEAITAFLEGTDFEDVIRLAVSLGGDCDTLTCIAGSIAEAFYGVPAELKVICRNRLTPDLIEVIDQFEHEADSMPIFHDPYLDGNEMITDAVAVFNEDRSEDHLMEVLDAISQRIEEGGHLIFPVESGDDAYSSFAFRTVEADDGNLWQVAFTSEEEAKQGPESRIIYYKIENALRDCLDENAAGFILNPWGETFFLSSDAVDTLFDDEDIDILKDRMLTAQDLEDGSLLKEAIQIFHEHKTESNIEQVLRILRDSSVWFPCEVITDDSVEGGPGVISVDMEVEEESDTPGGESRMVKKKVLMIPRLLNNGETDFLPVFSSEEEMDETKDAVSLVHIAFSDIISLVQKNHGQISGVVINAFSDPLELPLEVLNEVMDIDLDGDDEDGEEDE